MADVEFYVAGRLATVTFPKAMPPKYRVLILRSVLNGVNAVRIDTTIRNPVAYARHVAKRYVGAWDTPEWPAAEAELWRHTFRRSTVESTIDPIAALYTMCQSGTPGRTQYQAILGHAWCAEEACRLCRPLEAGAWPEVRDIAKLDAITVEATYKALREGHFVGEPHRPEVAHRFRPPTDPWAI
jgi:hypothetical protein